MKTKRLALLITISLFLFYLPQISYSFVKGIYISQVTLETNKKINYLVKNAKSVGINTFVVDYDRMSKRYSKNINLLHQNGIKYVARIVVFPYGGNHKDVTSKEYWQKKYRLVEQAINLGAQEIQLDYIRYASKRSPSSENAHNIYQVIQWFKNKVDQKKIPLEIAVFGETTYGESRSIGQNLRLFADQVDVVNPMLYPSHFEPFRNHAKKPYETVYNSLQALRKQFDNQIPFKVYPYIELSNYRYPLSASEKNKYIKAEIQAVEDANVDGWYAWSAGNQYAQLFNLLKNNKVR